MKLSHLCCLSLALGQSLLVGKPEEQKKSIYADLGRAFDGRTGAATPQEQRTILGLISTTPSLETNSQTKDAKTQERVEQELNERVAKTIAYQHKLYRIFADYDATKTQTPHTLHHDAWKDLRLVYGDKNSPLATLTATISHPFTKMGRVVTEKILISPTDDITTLQQRQLLLKKLISDDIFYTSLKTALETIASHEDNLLDIWRIDPSQDNGNLLNDQVNMYWEKKQPDHFTWWNPLDQWQYGSWRRTFDHHPTTAIIGVALTTLLLYQQISMNLFGITNLWEYVFSNRLTNPLKETIRKITGANAQPAIPFATAAQTLSQNLQLVQNKNALSPEEIKKLTTNTEGFVQAIQAVPMTGGTAADQAVDAVFSRAFVHEAKKIRDTFETECANAPLTTKVCAISKGTGKLGLHYYNAMSCVLWPLAAFGYFANILRNTFNAFKRAYREVNSIVNIMQAINSITPLLTNDEGRALTLLPELIQLSRHSTINEFNKLATTLQSPVHNPGTLLSTYKRLYELKDKFAATLEAIGELDAYVAMATTLRKHHATKNNFCLPSFELSTTPHLTIINAWNPLVNANEAVGNSLELGGKLRNRNAIITGPNAGGKSTFLRTVLTTILLGQTFGIAPATAASFTPFSYLDSYMNIEDNPAEKKSLFKMQGNRMTTLLNAVKAVAPGKHALVVVDELFSGTNPEDAAKIGLATAVHRLANQSNSIWVIATHHRKLTEAEQDTNGIFTNLQVNVNRDSHGKFLGYPFTISPGISQDSTACDVLASEGFDPDILKHIKQQ